MTTETTSEYRCVIELCGPTPGYKGFSMKAVQLAVTALKADPKAKKAFRFLRGRKMVFGFRTMGDRQDFLWQMNEMIMARGDVAERAYYNTENDLTDDTPPARRAPRRRTC